MPSSLENYLKELSDPSKPLVVSKLVKLSDLSAEEAKIFRREWPGIDVARRKQITEMLAELAEDNFDLDFDEVFRFCLADPDSEVKVKAIEGLEQSEERSLIDPLIGLLLGDLDSSVRTAAAHALGTFALLTEFEELPVSDADKIEKALLTVLNNENEQVGVRCRALESISWLNRPQVKELIRKAYQSDSEESRASAICAIGRTCSSDWLSILLQELRSPYPRLRFEAAKACGELESEEAIPGLIELTRDSDIEVRLSAISALGQIGGSRAREVLRKCLDSPEESISQAAQDALEEMKFWEDPFAL